MYPQCEAKIAVSPTTSEYSQEEREILLRLAHRAIDSTFEGSKIDVRPPTPHLAEMRSCYRRFLWNGSGTGRRFWLKPA